MDFEQVKLSPESPKKEIQEKVVAEKVPEEPKEKKEKQEPLKGTKEKKIEKTSKTPKEIKEHFKEELEKIKDLPKNTEYQKQIFYRESLKLLKDWLPFGNLDNFQGINEIMNLREEYKPKLALTFNYQKEKLAQQIAYEMAFQYPVWKAPNKEKTQIISEFIDTWLKEKSFYYQRAVEYQKYLTEPPEKYLAHREKYGYFAGEKIEEPTTGEKWLARETATLLKLLGKRDKTLSQVCKILAATGIKYSKGIQDLYENIENQNIKRNTGVKIRQIEESTDQERMKLLIKMKKELGTFPTLPLKIEYFKDYVTYLEKKDPRKAEMAKILIAELKEKEKQPENKKKLEEFQEGAKKIIQKEKSKPQIETVSKAKKYLEKKKSFLKDTAALFGYALLLFIVLTLLGEMELGKKLTGISVGGKK